MSGVAVALLPLCPLLCLCAKLLVVPPLVFDSHLRVLGHVAGQLEGRGHEVVFALHEGREWPGGGGGGGGSIEAFTFREQRYKGVFSGQGKVHFLQEKVQDVLSGGPSSLLLFGILKRSEENCELMVGAADFLSRLRAEGFDLVLVDPSELCGYVLARLIGVPYFLLSPSHWYPAEIGAPSPLSYVPEFNSRTTDRSGFGQRLWNVLVWVTGRAAAQWHVLPAFEAVLRRHRGDREARDNPSMMDLVTHTSFFLLSLDLALDFPRPSLPNVEFVGGILTRPAAALPQELRSWVEGSQRGVVLVSLGVAGQVLPGDLAEKMAATFARLPEQVMWSYFGETPQALGSNTHITGWIPQNDLLGHPKVLAFVSHCGLNGVYEAIYHGVPMVGMPIYGDQYDIATRVQAKGMGIYLDWAALTEERFYQAIRAVLDQPSYRKKAGHLSRILRDHPEHPLNRTVYWIEYLLRHEGALHLRPASYDLYAYQYYLLDVLAFCTVVTVAVFYLLCRVCGRFRKNGQIIEAKGSLQAHTTLLNGHPERGKKGD
ncbi:2-hydroxyacylsphingosine 1-beta-galactosyltransferase [Amia ocellicauda]|uniref:2-hydroxyacylsphingosine 1-beta-galactosyltransferase n=1 Tax=Amia ocellicauda TaxID=2972642 RepID=UPI0034644B85